MHGHCVESFTGAQKSYVLISVHAQELVSGTELSLNGAKE